MVRTLFGKLVWLGRATSAVVGLAVVLALVVGVSSQALAGNLDPLKIGSLRNVATNTTALVGKVASGEALVVKNPSGGPALGLQVGAGQAPLTVNAEAGTSTNLSADELDGMDSSAFLGKTEKAADADRLDGMDPGQLKGATAYARVFPGSAAFDEARTSGFTSAERLADGTYCLTPASGVDPARRPAVVTVDWQATRAPEGNAAASYNVNGCGDGRYQVTTERQSVSNGALIDQYTNDIGFVIVVP